MKAKGRWVTGSERLVVSEAGSWGVGLLSSPVTKFCTARRQRRSPMWLAP